MIVNLHLPMFQVSPAIRFSKQLEVEEKVWKDLWYRYKFLTYSPSECREWFLLTTHKEIGVWQLLRWFKRQEIYLKAQEVKDFDEIHINHFGELRDDVYFLLTKNKHEQQGNRTA